MMQRSRFWGTIWEIGDMSYFLGLLTSILSPLIVIIVEVLHFESWWGLMRALGLAVAFLVICFPLGFGISMSLKALARRRTGVTRIISFRKFVRWVNR